VYIRICYVHEIGFCGHEVCWQYNRLHRPTTAGSYLFTYGHKKRGDIASPQNKKQQLCNL